MAVSILTAIANIIIEPVHNLGDFYDTRNRATNMGMALEEYIKDTIAGTINEDDAAARLEQFDNTFSYLGNQSNPPDIIIKNGDAIEVKKIESAGAALALNSSYPKAKLFAKSSMITAACRECEEWEEKNIVFVVGVVNNKCLKKLYFVYGVDYAASAEIYERIKSKIKLGVDSIPDVEFAETDELGRVNHVDPLKITYLRIRGMWGIENPVKVFSYIFNSQADADFELMAVINTELYNSLEKHERDTLDILSKEIDSFSITNVRIKTPDNPAKLKDAKLLVYRR